MPNKKIEMIMSPSETVCSDGPAFCRTGFGVSPYFDTPPALAFVFVL